MKSFVFMMAVLFGVCFAGVGCGVFETSESSDTTSSSNTQIVESIFNSAMTAGSNALASGQPQELAVAAAEAIVASQVSDAETQAVFNQVIESEIPALANSLASALQSSNTTADTATVSAATDAKVRSVFVKTKFQKSNTFKGIVKNCVEKYKKIRKK